MKNTSGDDHSTFEYCHADFNHEHLWNCDLVMKGGITSGVVYPYAICELAKKYQFKNVGGTSAGAIAAAATAAAEFGRSSGKPNAGFVGLSTVALELESKIQSLFQPWPQAAPVYEALLAVLDQKSAIAKLLIFFSKVIPAYWVSFAIGTLPGVLLLGMIVCLGNTPAAILEGLYAVIIALGGGVVGLSYQLYKIVTQSVDKLFYGLCPGLKQKDDKKPALTDWLADLFDQLAGKDGSQESLNDQPLTFGELWASNLRGVEAEQAVEDPKQHQIKLEMMTTNLTHGIPHRLPTNVQDFWFDPKEFCELFPQKILNWMIARSPVSPDTFEVKDAKDPNVVVRKQLYQLPKPADIPVVVATRMSLSFPILLTAVPLYTIATPDKNEKKPYQVATKYWFSDGGISSNFPIHFFDDFWPNWPTFAISLDRLNPNLEPEEDVWLPDNPFKRPLPTLTVFDSIFNFLGAIFDTAQNWKDTSQAMLPAYRDRIVHIRLNKGEGGLQLKMPPGTVRALAARGRQAGRCLVNNFNWESHRWIRFLSSTAQLEEKLEVMQRAYEKKPPQGSNFEEFLQQFDLEKFLQEFLEEHPESKEVEKYLQSLRIANQYGWLDEARKRSKYLMKFSEEWQQQPFGQDGLIPHPEPELRVTPRS